MITFPCDKCDRLLEADDSAAGTKVECPHCADINIVPAAGARSGPAAARAKARPAAAVHDRAAAMGLPSEAGPESVALRVHSAMVRARPIAGLGLLVTLAVGLVGAGVSMATMPLLAAVFGAVALAGVVWFCVWKVRAMTTRLIITTKRTTLRRGILSKTTREVLHDRVQDVKVEQSFLQRMLGVGTLSLSSSSDEGFEIVMADVPDVIRVRDAIDAYRDM
ncbi:MAG: PH domain-containing protein [Phycisphaeraceae bacterium]|nr:PH domain-containing protein [Phycisphaeraceae bacterium]